MLESSFFFDLETIMFAYIPHEFAFIQTLLSHRIEWLNPFFIFLNHFDTGIFYCLIGITFYSCIKPKEGIRLMLLLGIVATSNFFLKNLFGQPRPLILDPSLGLVTSTSKFGLPSGAAQAATVIAMYFMNYFKKQWVVALGLFYIVLICISRVYIGMHFISDVVVGCMLGFILMKLYEKYGDSLIYKCTRFGVVPIYLLFCLFLVVAYRIEMPGAYQMGIGLLFGGLAAEHLLIRQGLKEFAHTPKEKLLHFGFSLLTFFLLLYLFKAQLVKPIFNLFLLMHILVLVTGLMNQLLGKNNRRLQNH